MLIFCTNSYPEINQMVDTEFTSINFMLWPNVSKEEEINIYGMTEGAWVLAGQDSPCREFQDKEFTVT